jgi:transposase
MAGLPTVKASSVEIKSFFARGLSKREIAKRLKVGRTSVRRVLRKRTLALSVPYFPFRQTTPRRFRTPGPAAVESG